MQETLKIIKTIYKHIDAFTSRPNFGVILSCFLLFIFLTVGTIAGVPARRRNLTTTPLLWAKLDSNLTDENSSGGAFAYSPGKPTTDYGITLKEGDNIQYGRGSVVDASSGIYENWNPNQGTMNVWVQPNWSGNDGERHWIWNADSGRIDTGDANLVAYWKFDEGSGAYAFDSSSNSNVGYIHGPALSFDGGDYVKIADHNSLEISTNSYSLECWIKTSTTSETQTILRKDNGGGTNGFIFRIEANDDLRVTFAGSSGAHIQESTDTVNDGNWHHVITTWDRANIRLYVDGSETSESPSAFVSVEDIGNDSALYIGSNTTAEYFDGIIDEVRIYSRALTSTEITARYAGSYTNESNLVGYWKMDDGESLSTTQTVADSSGNGNDGTRGADSESAGDDPTWVDYAPDWTTEGRFGEALTLDGVDDWVDVGDVDF